MVGVILAVFTGCKAAEGLLRDSASGDNLHSVEILDEHYSFIGITMSDAPQTAEVDSLMFIVSINHPEYRDLVVDLYAQD